MAETFIAGDGATRCDICRTAIERDAYYFKFSIINEEAAEECERVFCFSCGKPLEELATKLLTT